MSQPKAEEAKTEAEQMKPDAAKAKAEEEYKIKRAEIEKPYKELDASHRKQINNLFKKVKDTYLADASDEVKSSITDDLKYLSFVMYKRNLIDKDRVVSDTVRALYNAGIFKDVDVDKVRNVLFPTGKVTVDQFSDAYKERYEENDYKDIIKRISLKNLVSVLNKMAENVASAGWMDNPNRPYDADDIHMIIDDYWSYNHIDGAPVDFSWSEDNNGNIVGFSINNKLFKYRAKKQETTADTTLYKSLDPDEQRHANRLFEKVNKKILSGASEETKSAVLNDLKYGTFSQYENGNLDDSELVDETVKVLKKAGIDKTRDEINNVLFPPRGGAHHVKAKVQAEQETYDQVMNQPKAEEQQSKETKPAPKAEATKAKTTKAEETKAEAPKVEAKSIEQQTQEIFDQTVNGIEKEQKKPKAKEVKVYKNVSAASNEAQILVDAGINGDLANQTIDAIANKTGGENGNKRTWVNGTYNDILNDIAVKNGLDLSNKDDELKAREIATGLKKEVKDALSKNGYKATDVVQEQAETPKETVQEEQNTEEQKATETEQAEAPKTVEEKKEAIKKQLDETGATKDFGEEKAEGLAEAAAKDEQAKEERRQEEQAQTEEEGPDIKDVPKKDIKTNQTEKKMGHTDSDEAGAQDTAKMNGKQNNNEKIGSGKYIVRHIKEYEEAAKSILSMVKEGSKASLTEIANNFYNSKNSTEFAGKKTTTFKNIKNSFDYRDDGIMLSTGQQILDDLQEAKNLVFNDLKAAGISASTHVRSDVEGARKDTVVLTKKDANGNNVEVTDAEYDEVKKQLDAYNDAIFKVEEKIAGYTNNAGFILRLVQDQIRNSPSKAWDRMMDSVQNIQDIVDKKNRGKNIDIVNSIKNTYEDKWNNATAEEREKMVGVIADEVGDMIPSTFKEKLDSWRMLGMLFNPTTHIRNMGGNLMMQGIVSNKNFYRKLIEYAIEKTDSVQEHEFKAITSKDRQMLANVNKSLEDYGTATLKRYNSGTYQPTGELKAVFDKKFKGHDNFRFINDAKFRERMANEYAYQLRDAPHNYHLKEGDVLTDEQSDEIFNKAFNIASKNWLQRSDLRTGNRYGLTFKEGERRNQKQLIKQFYDKELDDNENVIDSTSMKGFEGRAYKKHSEQIYNSKLLNGLSHANSWALSHEDTIFTKARYVSTMDSMLTAQGYKLTGFSKEGNPIIQEYTGRTLTKENAIEVFNRISNTAFHEAQESTYHDENKAAQTLNDLAKENWVAGFMIDSIMPFRKTPMNIAKRMVEYSPVSLAKAIWQYKAVQNGTMTADQYINTLAEGMTGTEIVGLGMLLGHLGLLHGNDDDEDDKVSKFDKELGGKQDYSLVLPNGASYTLGWLAPFSGPLFAGVQLQHEIEDLRSDGDFSWLSLGKSTIAPILDASYFSGIQNAFDTANNYQEYGVKYTKNGETHKANFFDGLLIGAFQNYISQYSWAVGGKFVKAASGKDLDTFSTNIAEKMLRNAVSKDVALYYGTNWLYQKKYGHNYLEPRINSNGEEMESTGGSAGGRWAYQLLSPGSYKKNRMDATDEELKRLRKATGNDYVLPSNLYRLGKKDIDGEDKYIYNKQVLSAEKKAITDFVASPSYSQYSDDEKVKIINQIRTSHYHVAEDDYYRKNGFPIDEKNPFVTSSDKARQVMDGLADGTTYKEWQFYAIKNMNNDKDSDGNTIYNSKALNVRNIYERENIWEPLKKAIDDGKVDPKDVGLNNKVFNMDDAEFADAYQEYAEMTDTEYLGSQLGVDDSGDNYEQSEKNNDGSSDDNGGSGESSKDSGGSRKKSGGSSKKSKKSSHDESDDAIAMLKKFANAMSDASASQQKYYKKQLESSLKTLQKSDQDIYDEVMSADDLTKKLDLYGIKIKSQA